MDKVKGEDSRALLPENLELFKLGGKLHPFVQLVKKHEELELCFRGNGNPERVSIYFNNHQVFKIERSGTIRVSFNHARYCENWEDYLELLGGYDFNIPAPEKRFKKNKDSIGELKRLSDNPPLTVEEVENLYTDIIYPIVKQYFDVGGVKGTVDYFKRKYNDDVEDASKKLNDIVTPYRLTEKIKQQELYSSIKEKKSGYFFYDLEFAQRHENRTAQGDDRANNKPDMQAIKFDENGKPEKIVFVEVKCTEVAWKAGRSGLADHIKRMKLYEKQKESMDARRIEAYQILTQYAELGLRGLDESINFQHSDFIDLPLEILIVLTGDAKSLWNKDESESMMRIKENAISHEPRICPSYDEAHMYVL